MSKLKSRLLPNLLWIGLLGALIAAFITNPSHEEHQHAIHLELKSTLAEKDSTTRLLVDFLGDRLVGPEHIPLKLKNYYLFSQGKVDLSLAGQGAQYSSLGLFTHVFVFKNKKG